MTNTNTQPLIYVFTSFNDPAIFEIAAELQAASINFRETSQTGDDITFYLEGHPKFNS